MIEKPIMRRMRKDLVKNVGQQLFELRKQKNQDLFRVGNYSGIPPKIMEFWEVGKGFLDIEYLFRLALYHDKKLVITFQDLSSDDLM